jgi:DNA invertase Pin-like site-specific DNA recombinase
MTTIGYARVSTDGQSLQSQTEALHLAGCGKVYSEKQSGVYTDRPQLAKAIAALAEGDCLVVCKLDRLARSTRDLLSTLDTIGKAGATFRSLGDAWADTTTPAGKLMLTVLGGLAEYERHLILSRTAEGRTRVKLAGVRFGRHPSLTPISTCRSTAQTGCGRDAGGDRQKLQRVTYDYRETDGAIASLAWATDVGGLGWPAHFV